MRVAISTTGEDLSSPVSPVFGRCPAYIFVDTDTLEFEAVSNQAVSAPGGAGIQAAQMVTEQGAEAVITGNVGPNAFNVLSSAGVQIYLTQGGTVQQAVEALKAGQLQSLGGPSAGMHAGMGMGRGMAQGTGRGMGQGMGRGMGRGMGQGMGRGMGQGMGGSGGIYGAGAPPAPFPGASAAPTQAGIDELRTQMSELRQQMAQVLDRIDKLGKK